MFVKYEQINDFVLIYKILGYKNILQIEYSYFTEQDSSPNEKESCVYVCLHRFSYKPLILACLLYPLRNNSVKELLLLCIKLSHI